MSIRLWTESRQVKSKDVGRVTWGILGAKGSLTVLNSPKKGKIGQWHKERNRDEM